MDENGIQDEINLNQNSDINSVDHQSVTAEQTSDNRDNIIKNDEVFLKNSEENEIKKAEAISQASQYNQNQIQWMNRQVTNMERELLLNNNKNFDNNFMGNWAKVILAALAVFIPGIGQIIGIIVGLVFISNDINADKRSYGAALVTVSLVVFIISICFWFIFALIFGPKLY